MTARERRMAADRRVDEKEFKRKIRALQRKVKELRDEVDGAYALFPPLLAGVAEALKGSALADWSDLPEVAATVKRDLDLALQKICDRDRVEELPDFVPPHVEPPSAPPEPDLPKCPTCGRLLGSYAGPNDCVCSQYPGAGAG